MKDILKDHPLDQFKLKRVSIESAEDELEYISTARFILVNPIVTPLVKTDPEDERLNDWPLHQKFENWKEGLNPDNMENSWYADAETYKKFYNLLFVEGMEVRFADDWRFKHADIEELTANELPVNELEVRPFPNEEKFQMYVWYAKN